ncbi:30S ribosomal protein S6e [Desulfurococcus mucosus]|uniref:Small ribosomal subunit protein eS6 n=1 Tax=Desulfurococcus mucosus (strain ATCC 35584 / DSM 2162 / JCM 9187 / O7/1) TaxID=765177 RepID=E8R7G9_DESM0|nr:30S ribosomal protein S6e [Desulfurococcus mucosus]ADV65634.1 SSU ribosomal protein S6E [Desulfurococcus mucosus DSM 2162]
MPDFKIVVNDPEAPKKEKLVKVKVEGDSEIPFTDRVKEKFELPVFKMNSKTAAEIGAVHGVATIRVRRPDTGDKVKFTGRIVIDDNVPDYVVKVNMEQLINATGQNELEGVIFRARAWQIRVNDERTQSLLGLRIGDSIDGSIVGLKGVRLTITGGSDISGFPMRPDVSGPVKKKVLLSGPPGFHPEEDGERRRKMVRGNTIAPDIVQVNTKITYESK